MAFPCGAGSGPRPGLGVRRLPARLPHLGRVVLEEGVTVGSNTCIDRGALGETRLGRRTRIDNLVHIAHNVRIGADCAVIAHAMIAGGVTVGDGAWVAPSAAVLNQQSIGANAVIGLGAVVIRSVAAGQTVVGNPATPSPEPVALIDSFRRVLVLCAGTVLRLVASGAEVRYLALSACEASVPDGLPRDVLTHECRACTEALGIPAANVEIGPFPVRYFPRDRRAILERLVEIAHTYAPDLVLLPSSLDTHEDHAIVVQEGFRAFKRSSILGLRTPTEPRHISELCVRGARRTDARSKDLCSGAVPLPDVPPILLDAFIRGLATVRGVQCGADYAEAFEVVRLIVL